MSAPRHPLARGRSLELGSLGELFGPQVGVHLLQNIGAGAVRTGDQGLNQKVRDGSQGCQTSPACQHVSMSASHPPAWNLSVLGCWQLRRNEQTVEVGARQKRLISVLALLGPRSRDVVAGLLWPESSEMQAAGNLRASLFRITHDLPVLVRSADPLQLEPSVIVDPHDVRHLIDEITTSAARPARC